MPTTRYTPEYLHSLIHESDRVVIGAGSGLSAAAGISYSGPVFEKEFSDFIEKYGITDLYSSSFYPFKTPNEYWACWARHIDLIRYRTGATSLYGDLLSLLDGKEYFVITTNVDAQFEKAGFDKSRLFAVQGDYAYLQCSRACHDRLYYNEQMVKEMVSATKDCRIPSSMVPVCPVCGEPMEVHVRVDGYFIQDSAWDDAYQRYRDFIQKSLGKKTLLLELGVGFNTPTIIRFPFDAMAQNYDEFTLVRINKDQREYFSHESKAVKMTSDIAQVIRAME